MKSIKICAAVTGTAALIALFVALAGTSASGAANTAAQSGRSSQAAAAEAAMTRVNLQGRLEADLGSAYGGVWFDPAAAQLHVGVTSPAGQQRAAALAAELGMPGILVEAPVGSSWNQLEAAQDRWDAAVMDLIERGEAATSLAPERNAVEVELGTTVPASRRVALEHEAAESPVGVEIAATPYANLGAVPQARCNEFAEDKAFCDKPLVGGVTFDPPSKETCTTGPAVIKKNGEEPTNTYVLTAGHCIDDSGGAGETWVAYNKEGKEKGQHEVGEAKTFLNEETDVGVVEVSTTYWAEAAAVPLTPTLAPWDQKAPEPFSVVGSKAPALNTNACVSGQTSGTSCGKIIKTNQTIEVGGVVTKNLIEVEKAKTAGGDSGAPWYSETEFKESPPRGLVEGTHVGRKGETGNPVFEPLSISFAELNKEKGWNLELLTTGNMLRHASVKFHSEIERTFFFGEQATENVLTMAAGKVKCKKAQFSSDVTGSEKAASDFVTGSIDLTPTYSECTAFGQAATVTTTGCKYRITGSSETAGNLVIVCETGKAIQVDVPTGNCSLKVEAQTPGENGLEYKNEGAGAARVFRITSKVGKLAYTVAGPGTICGTVGAHTDGVYSGTILEKGFKNAAHTEQVGVWVK
jgi:hypothetical protein